jgi:hypothetical protein
MHEPTLATIAMATFLSALGCGGSSPSHPPAPGTSASDASPPSNGCDLGLCPPDPARGLQLTLDAKIQPGEENRFCKYVLFHDAHEYSRMEHRYTTPSHHIVLYPTTLAAGTLEGQTHVTLDQVFSCDTVVDRKQAGLIYAAQTPEAVIDYPAGVAYPIAAGQIGLIEYHVINPGRAAVDVKFRMNLEFVQGDVQNYAGTLFFYNSRIVIQPRSKATVQAHCELPQDLTLVYGASHMHARGVSQRSWLIGINGGVAMPLFDTKDWSEPRTKTYDPPIALHAGQFIGFSCDYENLENRTIHEGPKTTDEMCMAPFGYYAPKDAPAMDFDHRLCWTKGSGAVFSGTKTCKEFSACVGAVMAKELPIALQVAAAGRAVTEDDLGDDLYSAGQQCWLDTSEASSQALNDLHGPSAAGGGGCRNVQCAAAPGNPCWYAVGTPACDACLQQRCAVEVAACDVAQ